MHRESGYQDAKGSECRDMGGSGHGAQEEAGIEHGRKWATGKGGSGHLAWEEVGIAWEEVDTQKGKVSSAGEPNLECVYVSVHKCVCGMCSVCEWT